MSSIHHSFVSFEDQTAQFQRTLPYLLQYFVKVPINDNHIILVLLREKKWNNIRPNNTTLEDFQRSGYQHVLARKWICFVLDVMKPNITLWSCSVCTAADYWLTKHTWDMTYLLTLTCGWADDARLISSETDNAPEVNFIMPNVLTKSMSKDAFGLTKHEQLVIITTFTCDSTTVAQICALRLAGCLRLSQEWTAGINCQIVDTYDNTSPLDLTLSYYECPKARQFVFSHSGIRTWCQDRRNKQESCTPSFFKVPCGWRRHYHFDAQRYTRPRRWQ